MLIFVDIAKTFVVITVFSLLLQSNFAIAKIVYKKTRHLDGKF